MGVAVARYSQTQNIDEPLAMLRSSATSYYHADGLGSVTSLSNAAGALAQSYTYDSFGKQTASSGSLTNPFRYTARESDAETGLYYHRARYYDSTAGRFINEDPIGFLGGGNFYAYVSNDPANHLDPTGLAPGGPCLDINKFVKWLDDHAHDKSTGHCAEYFRKGLEAGGLDTTGRPNLAKDYGPFLQKLGFSNAPPPSSRCCCFSAWADP